MISFGIAPLIFGPVSMDGPQAVVTFGCIIVIAGIGCVLSHDIDNILHHPGRRRAVHDARHRHRPRPSFETMSSAKDTYGRDGDYVSPRRPDRRSRLAPPRRLALHHAILAALGVTLLIGVRFGSTRTRGRLSRRLSFLALVKDYGSVFSSGRALHGRRRRIVRRCRAYATGYRCSLRSSE
jgi:hypothetical protein